MKATPTVVAEEIMIQNYHSFVLLHFTLTEIILYKDRCYAPGDCSAIQTIFYITLALSCRLTLVCESAVCLRKNADISSPLSINAE